MKAFLKASATCAIRSRTSISARSGSGRTTLHGDPVPVPGIGLQVLAAELDDVPMKTQHSGGCPCDESSVRRVPLGQKQSAALVSPKPNPTSQPGRNAAAVNGRPQRREERLDSPRRRLRPRRTTDIVPSMWRLSYRQLPPFPGLSVASSAQPRTAAGRLHPSSEAGAGEACRLPLSSAP